MQASEMRYLRSVTRRDRLYNEDMCKEFNIFDIQDRIADNKEKWIVHMNRMPDGRLPKEVWKYKPLGQSTGRSRRRW